MVVKPSQPVLDSAKRKSHLSSRASGNISKFVTPERMIGLTSILVGLLIWFVVTAFNWVSPLFLPSPAAVVSAFLEIVHDGYKGSPLLFHIYASMYRLGVALVLTVVTAVPLGMICGLSPQVRAAFDPWVEFYRPLPPLAYYALLVIWLGIENPSKIVLLYLAAFAPLFIAVVDGVKRIPRDRINGARSLGASGWQIFVYVVFPSCLPDVFTGLRIAIGAAYSTLVAAEMVAAISGLGWMVLDASKFLRSDVIFVGIIIIGIIAVLIDAVIRWIQKAQAPWIGHDV